MTKKSLALFDLDKTIYNDHAFFGATKFLADEGVLSANTWVDVTTELGKYKNKSQTYSQTANNLLGIFARDLRGKDEMEIKNLVKDFFEANNANFYAYFEYLLPRLKKTHKIYLITNNFQPVAQAVVDRFGLDGYISTEFEVVEGRFTGLVQRSLADGKRVVEELLVKYGGETMAVGDSENDMEMLARVKHAVCINPSDELKVEALKRGWMITTDKTIEDDLARARLC
jgi:HAD superfamily phosphoserine phosphatase-like hydrolase